MAELLPGFRIRQATPEDHTALKDICLKTGDSGKDGTHLQDDPDLLGLVYAEPYQVFAPDFAFVLEDTGGVCGYCLGAPDTAAFQDWMDKVWYPPLRSRTRNPGPDETHWQQSDWVRWRIFARPALPPVDLSRFPAHGHIDLHPRAQGRGLGAPLMLRLTTELARAGCPGLFLEVSHQNLTAQRFYARLGFETLGSLPGAIIMGRELGEAKRA